MILQHPMLWLAPDLERAPLQSHLSVTTDTHCSLDRTWSGDPTADLASIYEHIEGDKILVPLN
jgi:hypothetical protein